ASGAPLLLPIVNAPAGTSTISLLMTACGTAVAPAWAGAWVDMGAVVGGGGGATVAIVGRTIGVKATMGAVVGWGAAVGLVSASKEQPTTNSARSHHGT